VISVRLVGRWGRVGEDKGYQMEILRDENYRYILEHKCSDNGYIGCVLRLHQPKEQQKPPRTADRYPLNHVFKEIRQLVSAANEVAQRASNGDLSLSYPASQRRVEKYVLHAFAVFNLEKGKWEGFLKIVSKKKENKGAVQLFDGKATPLQRNLFPSPERATEFAFQYGEELVRGLFPGLEI